MVNGEAVGVLVEIDAGRTRLTMRVHVVDAVVGDHRATALGADRVGRAEVAGLQATGVQDVVQDLQRRAGVVR